MSRIRNAARADLFADADPARTSSEALAEGALLLRGFAVHEAKALMNSVEQIAAKAPFRHMITPGGYRMSVAMTNCGRAGWITDRRGYRYGIADPVSQDHWPAMPPLFEDLASRAAAAAGFAGFAPDACL